MKMVRLERLALWRCDMTADTMRDTAPGLSLTTASCFTCFALYMRPRPLSHHFVLLFFLWCSRMLTHTDVC